MMKAYSQDLRKRVLQTVDEEKTQVKTASLLKVSEATVKRYVRQRREKGHVQPKPIPGRPAARNEHHWKPGCKLNWSGLLRQPCKSIVTCGKRKQESK